MAHRTHPASLPLEDQWRQSYAACQVNDIGADNHFQERDLGIMYLKPRSVGIIGPRPSKARPLGFLVLHTCEVMTPP